MIVDRKSKPPKLVYAAASVTPPFQRELRTRSRRPGSVQPPRATKFLEILRTVHESCLASESIDQAVVPVVEIVAELEFVVPDECGEVEQVHRDLLGQVHALPLAGSQRLPDALRCPLRMAAQHEFGEPARVLDAYTAVGEGTHALVEKMLGGSVVKVDREAVRKHELHATQRVLRSGTLTDAVLEVLRIQVAHREVAEWYHLGVLLPGAHHLIFVPLEVAGIRQRLRKDLLLRDLVRDVPVRAELDVAHGVRESGSAGVR